MITAKIEIRPRYDETDQMGYVYHANYVSYCHIARTELMRKLGMCDKALEDKNILLPVISIDLKFHHPAHYDELLTIQTTLKDYPVTRLTFDFKIFNEKQQLICSALSTVVCVNKMSRKPLRLPEFVKNALAGHIFN